MLRSLIKAGVALAAAVLMTMPAIAQEKLTFVSWMVDEPGYGDWWKEVVTKFEGAHPGVTVEMTKVTRADYADTMLTMFAGGNPPDIVHLAAFEYQAFADQGFLEDLGPWFAKSNIPLKGWAGQSTCEWKGKTYCLMMLYIGYVFAYNEKLLSDAGVTTIPHDWPSLLDAARRATRDTDGDGLPDVYGFGLDLTGGTNMMHEMLNFVLDAGGNWTKDGKPAFDSPAVIEALTRWKTIVDEHLTPEGNDDVDIDELMREEHIAMRIDGPWLYNIIKDADPAVKEHLKLDLSPLKPNVGGTSNVLGMPASLSSEKKQLVWDFIETAASEEMQERFATLGSSPAPRPGLDYSSQIKDIPYFELFAKANDEAAAAGVDRLPKGLELTLNQVAKIVFQEVQRMIIESRAPADVAAEIQKQVLAL